MAKRLDRAGIRYEVLCTRVLGLIQFNLTDPNGIRHDLMSDAGPEAVIRVVDIGARLADLLP